MQEIQDMTLNLSRGLERLNQQLEERATLFEREFERLETPGEAFGIRLTAVPVGEEVWFNRVFRDHNLAKELTKPPIKVFRRMKDGSRSQLKGIMSIHNLSPALWRLQLRSARAEDDHASRSHKSSQANNSDHNPLQWRHAYWEVHCNGMIEIGFLSVARVNWRGQTTYMSLHPDVPNVMCADIAVWANHLRHQAGVPTAEYALDAEIRVVGQSLEVVRESYYLLGRLGPGHIVFPRYSLGVDDIPSLLGSFEYDFFSTFGLDISDAQENLEIECN